MRPEARHDEAPFVEGYESVDEMAGDASVLRKAVNEGGLSRLISHASGEPTIIVQNPETDAEHPDN